MSLYLLSIYNCVDSISTNTKRITKTRFIFYYIEVNVIGFPSKVNQGQLFLPYTQK